MHIRHAICIVENPENIYRIQRNIGSGAYLTILRITILQRPFAQIYTNPCRKQTKKKIDSLLPSHFTVFYCSNSNRLYLSHFIYKKNKQRSYTHLNSKYSTSKNKLSTSCVLCICVFVCVCSPCHALYVYFCVFKKTSMFRPKKKRHIWTNCEWFTMLNSYRFVTFPPNIYILLILFHMHHGRIFALHASVSFAVYFGVVQYPAFFNCFKSTCL